MIARRIGYAVSGLVILSSGAYLFVYLYRWEWNRALIAGVIFVAAEVALAAMMILEKLRAIEERIEQRSPERSTLGAIKESAPPPRQRFKWLTGDGDQLSVFIPVLMGAGMIFSGVAWLVERLARVTAKPALEQGLAMRLQPLALPEGGFLSPVDSAPPVATRRPLRFKKIFYGFVFAATVFLFIDVLGDLTQNRPELDVSPGAVGAVTLEITREGWTRSDPSAARSLWHACRHTVSHHFQATSFIDQGGGVVTMHLTPAPGASAERRLRGCLNDATLDNVLARVVSFSTP